MKKNSILDYFPCQYHYILTVYGTGERPNWSYKRKSNYGSTRNYISVTQTAIR